MLANRSVTSLVSYHKLSMADNIWAGLRLGQCTSGFGGGGGGGAKASIINAPLTVQAIEGFYTTTSTPHRHPQIDFSRLSRPFSHPDLSSEIREVRVINCKSTLASDATLPISAAHSSTPSCVASITKSPAPEKNRSKIIIVSLKSALVVNHVNNSKSVPKYISMNFFRLTRTLCWLVLGLGPENFVIDTFGCEWEESQWDELKVSRSFILIPYTLLKGWHRPLLHDHLNHQVYSTDKCITYYYATLPA